MGRERQELFRESNTKDKERIIVLAFEGNDTEEIPGGIGSHVYKVVEKLIVQPTN